MAVAELFLEAAQRQELGVTHPSRRDEPGERGSFPTTARLQTRFDP